MLLHISIELVQPNNIMLINYAEEDSVEQWENQTVEYNRSWNYPSVLSDLKMGITIPASWVAMKCHRHRTRHIVGT